MGAIMNIIEKLRAIFENPKPIPQGFYTYHTPENKTPQYRLHLRVEPDGEGVLIVNASTILHLNQTATEMVYNLINGKSDQENARLVASHFKVDPQTCLTDVTLLHHQLEELVTTIDLDPEHQGIFEAHNNVDNLSAPYRLDCYLNGGSLGLKANLKLDDWKNIIKKAYEAGIPHILFCGSEPTEVEYLTDLLAYTEEFGLVSGLVSRGQKLSDSAYVARMIESGLDHLYAIYEPSDPLIQTALQQILPLDLFTCVGLVVREGVDYGPILDSLSKLGANAFSVISPATIADKFALQLTEDISSYELRLINDLPIPVEYHHPTMVDMAITGKESYTELSVSPKGEVYADNTWQEKMGNWLSDSFEDIWSKRKMDE